MLCFAADFRWGVLEEGRRLPLSGGLPAGRLKEKKPSFATLTSGLIFSLAPERKLSSHRKNKARPAVWRGQAFSLVGVRRLELPAPTSRT